MNLSRRGFLTGLIAAPAIIAVDQLMPIKPWMPVVYGDGIHDDWPGLQALLNNEPVDIRAGRLFVFCPSAPELGFTSVSNTYALSRPLILPGNTIRRDFSIGDHFMKHASFPPTENRMLIFGTGCHHSVFMNGYFEGGVHQL